MKYLAFLDYRRPSSVTGFQWSIPGALCGPPNQQKDEDQKKAYTIMEFADYETMHAFLFLSSRKPVKWEEIKKTDHIRFEKYVDDSDLYMLNEDKVNELRGL